MYCVCNTCPSFRILSLVGASGICFSIILITLYYYYKITVQTCYFVTLYYYLFVHACTCITAYVNVSICMCHGERGLEVINKLQIMAMFVSLLVSVLHLQLRFVIVVFWNKVQVWIKLFIIKFECILYFKHILMIVM